MKIMYIIWFVGMMIYSWKREADVVIAINTIMIICLLTSINEKSQNKRDSKF